MEQRAPEGCMPGRRARKAVPYSLPSRAPRNRGQGSRKLPTTTNRNCVGDKESGMRAKRPTAMLEEEHRSIQKIVAAMAVLADRLETGQRIEPTTLQNMVEFMRTFAD